MSAAPEPSPEEKSLSSIAAPHAPVSPWRGWIPLWLLSLGVASSPLLPFGYPTDRPRWELAWLYVFAFFGAMKWLTWRRTTAPAASRLRHLGYLIAWPGLDAPTFLRSTAARNSVVDPREGVVAFGKIFLGATLFWVAARCVPPDWPIVQSWVGLTGLAIGLLGGFFHLLSWLWRAGGIDAQRLMIAPLRSVSLAEFWGRRWNTAFHDFVRRFVYQPIALRFGSLSGTTGVFLFSGVLHDAVLSLPAQGGYGRPTLYFLIQLVGLGCERSSLGRRVRLGHGLRGRIFTALVVVGPVGLLFHRPFVEHIWLPFMQAAGAL
ncbi:MAG: membrane bound O-acyl transferase family-domain-containing protein [Planctomycetia bacterium]|nr:membrane bound O-acyl transferase family-domain-containing protein [Planctomycetia bacterium]